MSAVATLAAEGVAISAIVNCLLSRACRVFVWSARLQEGELNGRGAERLLICRPADLEN